jgi:hypothetical protein
VYVEIPSPGNTPARAYDKHAPRSAGVILYLEQVLATSDSEVLVPSAGRPPGQPLFQTVTPEGFLMESDDDVVRVIDQQSYTLHPSLGQDSHTCVGR